MTSFITKNRNNAFNCLNCKATVPPLTNGSYRNHCPFCLHSLHVDISPGDRANLCQGILRPIEVIYSAKKGWVIIHKCNKCGEIKRNKAALNDECPDNYEEIVLLSTSLPFRLC